MKKQLTKQRVKNYRELRSQLSEKALSVSDVVRTELLMEMDLREFRKDIAKVTQTAVAAKMGVSQAEVSKLERRRDMLISTLCDYCKAVGAEVHITAVLRDGLRTVSAKFKLGDDRVLDVGEQPS